MNYYIADLHFGHKRCIEMDQRPFSSVEEMDETLISNWNNKVNEHDDVYIIGDFSYKAVKEATEYLKQLKGHKHLIVGNHDLKLIHDQQAFNCFESVDYFLQIQDGREIIYLCHYPMAEWPYYHRNTYHIYGHIHNNKDETYEFMSKREKALNDLQASVTGLAMTAAAKLLSEQRSPENDRKRYQAFLASAGEKHD